MAIEEMWLLIALIAGMMLGFSYLGGLWFTIRQLPTATYPMILVLGSFILRIGTTVCGFYVVMGGHWVRLLIGLLGFLLIRAILVRRWGIQDPTLALMKG